MTHPAKSGTPAVEPEERPSVSLDSLMFDLDGKFIRTKVEEFLALKATGQFTPAELRSHFLMQTIGRWTDPFCEGMAGDVGHALYRITDLMDPEERAAIEVYPGENGWETVEDWRREWERLHPGGIPQLSAEDLKYARTAILAGETPETQN